MALVFFVALVDFRVVLDLLDLSFLTLAFSPEVEVGMEQQVRLEQ